MSDEKKLYKVISHISIGWETKVKATSSEEARKIVKELAWDDMHFRPGQPVVTNDVEVDVPIEITKTEEE